MGGWIFPFAHRWQVGQGGLSWPLHISGVSSLGVLSGFAPLQKETTGHVSGSGASTVCVCVCVCVCARVCVCACVCMDMCFSSVSLSHHPHQQRIAYVCCTIRNQETFDCFLTNIGTSGWNSCSVLSTCACVCVCIYDICMYVCVYSWHGYSASMLDWWRTCCQQLLIWEGRTFQFPVWLQVPLYLLT